MTKRARADLNIEKSHANDAYCMGSMKPKHRTRTQYFEKRRRNNRILEKFYDAKYVDMRDGKIKKAAELGCNRTSRSVPRGNPQNERIFRGEKVSKGRRNIRRQRYLIQPGSVVIFGKKKYISKGCQHYGEYVSLQGHTAVKATRLQILSYSSGWVSIR